ncbi:1731_t:CDS:2, partial [Funneliformis caledonium]
MKKWQNDSEIIVKAEIIFEFENARLECQTGFEVNRECQTGFKDTRLDLKDAGLDLG